jgi:adenosylcobinamide-phosphate synthase
MTPTRLAAAYTLDWIVGDPHSFPHPVSLIGKAASFGERLLRPGKNPNADFLSGSLLTAAVVSGSWQSARIAVRKGGPVTEVLLAWTTLATRSLLDETAAVLNALDSEDLALARRRLATIVGRDTASLPEGEILRAVIETAAEGLCDGIVAPLFYLALGGVPLAFAYKAINTLDSMIGHFEPPYRYFGRLAARLDDGANFLPARLAALAIVAGAFLMQNRVRQSWLAFRRDGRKHPSPNAGQTEAAMAGALGVRLGGINYYDGRPSLKPLLYTEGRQPTRTDARASLRIVALASLASFATALLVRARS